MPALPKPEATHLRTQGSETIFAERPLEQAHGVFQGHPDSGGRTVPHPRLRNAHLDGGPAPTPERAAVILPGYPCRTCRGVSRTTIYRMPDISTLFAAALVSAVVALGVEWLADIEAAGAEILPAAQALDESFREVMLFTSGRAIDLTAGYMGMVRGAMASNRTWREKGEMLFDGTARIMDVLAGPGQVPRYWVYRARWRYRRRRVQEAEAFLRIGGRPGAPHGDDARRPVQLL